MAFELAPVDNSISKNPGDPPKNGRLPANPTFAIFSVADNPRYCAQDTGLAAQLLTSSSNA